MEGIFPIIVGFLIIVGINFAFRAFFGAVGAGVQAATKGGNFGDHWKRNTFGMSGFELRTRALPKAAGDQFTTIEVEGRGLIPVSRATNISFVTSLLDVTNQENNPVLSRVDDFSEKTSTAYQFAMTPITVQPNQGFSDWVRVGVIIPELLTPARSGNRRLSVIVRLTDANNPPSISLGYRDPNGPASVAEYQQTLDWSFSNKGYEETAEARDRMRPLIVKLGVAVAMADGNFGEVEAKTISKWIERQLSTVSDAKRESVKKACNDALRTGYADARSGSVSFSQICNEINSNTAVAERYEAIELCLDVMAADGKAETSELRLIKQVSEVLELDYEELQRMKDQRLVGVQVQLSDGGKESMEAALGIEPGWDAERVRAYLRDQFKVWNGRLTNTKDPEERANIQARLDLISKARTKYAS